MTRLNPTLLALLALPCLPALGHAQAGTPAPRESLHQEIERRVAADMARVEKEVARAQEQAREAQQHARDAQQQALAIQADAFAGHELGRERVVKGAPYCAEAVHETVQTLADGNRIVRKQSTQLCRDGEGRTRREVLGSGGTKLVYLRDPVAKENWVLNPETKSVRRLAGSMAWHGDGHAEHWREWAREFSQRMRESFKDLPHPPVPPRPPQAPKAAKAQGEPAVVVETEVQVRPGDTADKGDVRREVRVIRLSDLPAGATMAPLPPLPPMPPIPPLPGTPGGWQFGHFAPRGEAVVTALPAKEIDGLKVSGERSTWTIEAGKIGNERPIVITREVWTSPELMLTVHSRDADPRSGEINYRLQNIKRGEPDAALMRLPPDYAQPRRAPRTPAPPDADKKTG